MGDGFRQFGMTLVGVSAAAALLEWLAPDGEDLKKYVHLVSALCLLCVLTSPLAGAIGYLRDLSPADLLPDFLTEADGTEEERERYWNVFDDRLTREGLAEASRALENGLCGHFGFAQGNCRVVLSLAPVTGSEGDDAVDVRVMLSGTAIWTDPREIVSYVELTTGLSCRVAVEGGGSGRAE